MQLYLELVQSHSRKSELSDSSNVVIPLFFHVISSSMVFRPHHRCIFLFPPGLHVAAVSSLIKSLKHGDGLNDI